MNTSEKSVNSQAKRPKRRMSIVIISIIIVAGLVIGSVLIVPLLTNSTPKLQANGDTCFAYSEINEGKTQNFIICDMALSNKSAQSVMINGCSVTLDGTAVAGAVHDVSTVPGNTVSLKEYCWVTPPSGFTPGATGSTVNGTLTAGSTTIPFSCKWLF